MLTPDAMFYTSIVAVLLVMVFAINNARIVKKGKTLNPIHGLIPAIATITFHTTWWLSQYRGPDAVLAYVLGTVASTAFLFGTAFMTTGCLAFKDGTLCIDKDNKAFQLFNRLPINFEGRSLCTISWLAAGCIFLLPVLILLTGVLGAVVALVICAITWQNPVKYYLQMMTFTEWPDTEMKKTKKGYIFSPVFWLGSVSAIGGALYAIGTNIQWVASRSVVIVGILIALYIPYWLLLRTSKHLIEANDSIPEMIRERTQDSDTRKAYRTISECNDWAQPLFIFGLFWQLFRQKFCPKIQYCCKDDMGNSNCE